MAHWQLWRWMALVLCLVTGAARSDDHAAAHWQALARGELAMVRQAVRDAHPGMVDPLNPGFLDWAERGYLEALQLLPRVEDYDGMLSVLRYYTTGFLDGHLYYSDNARGDGPPPRVHGFGLRFDAERGYVVSAVLPAWPLRLPPLGARLLSCDGDAPEALIERHVAPFIDRRGQAGLAELRARYLSVALLSRMSSCRFLTEDGRQLDLALHYQRVGWEQFQVLLASKRPPPSQRENGHDLEQGLLWVRVADFQARAEQLAALERQLLELRALTETPHTLVFDLRGNEGGDSAIGTRIFEAATGGLVFRSEGLAQLPRTHALWRVSALSISTGRARLDRSMALYGASSPQVERAREFLQGLEAAHAAGQTWIEQGSEPLLTRAELQARGARLRRFPEARLWLITDANCVSACLDFADLVRRVPGARHLGQETGADSLYIDVGRLRTPGGNRLVLPLKVWRNRPRGNHETLLPDVVLKEVEDDAMLRAAVWAHR